MDPQAPQAASTPKVCFPLPSGDIICRDPPFVGCDPPLVYMCAPSAPTLCQCVQPAIVQLCTATITYAPTNPALPTLAPVAPGCDAGLELALAVIVARLLGAP